MSIETSDSAEKVEGSTQAILEELKKLAGERGAGVMLTAFTLHDGQLRMRRTTINFPVDAFPDAADMFSDDLSRELIESYLVDRRRRQP